mmetsp:Transcript_49773/g.55568  ORF Transcript_49773/g.55568 Transcript_49773/m.55568 type:complete len:122 (+) Transcript_49773:334-699(+)
MLFSSLLLKTVQSKNGVMKLVTITDMTRTASVVASSARNRRYYSSSMSTSSSTTSSSAAAGLITRRATTGSVSSVFYLKNLPGQNNKQQGNFVENVFTGFVGVPIALLGIGGLYKLSTSTE